MSFSKRYPKTAKALRYTGNALRVAHQAYNMAQTVASIVNSEKKNFDVNPNVNPDSAVPSVTCLSNMAQGDTSITRNGNSIAMKSLQARLQLTFDDAAAGEILRISIVRDNDNLGGATPAVTDVFASAGVLALRNLNTPKRFTVLYDKLFTCRTDQNIHIIEYFKKFKMQKDAKGNPTRSVKALFDGATGADLTRGHYWLMIQGNTATASTTSNVAGFTRIRFYDN